MRKNIHAFIILLCASALLSGCGDLGVSSAIKSSTSQGNTVSSETTSAANSSTGGSTSPETTSSSEPETSSSQETASSSETPISSEDSTSSETPASSSETPVSSVVVQNIEVTFDIYNLARWGADGAALVLRMSNAAQTVTDCLLTLTSWTRYSTDVPDDSTTIQVLRYNGDRSSLWEQSNAYVFDKTVKDWMFKDVDGTMNVVPYVAPSKVIYIDFAAVTQGGERFGVYFYNATTSANTWIAPIINASHQSQLVVPEGMLAFKVLRTSITDAPLSWSCDYWGASGEILLDDTNNFYTFTDFNNGAFLGTWSKV